MTPVLPEGQAPVDLVAAYWSHHIHDQSISENAVGSPGFFQDLAEYRYSKLSYLPALIDFEAHRGQRILEIGCGVGIDLVRFARAGAVATGIDLSPTAIELARLNLAQSKLSADLAVMNGEALGFETGAFDLVYAHGVLPYLQDPVTMIRDTHRVLRPGGKAILMVYNRRSWLHVLSKVTRVKLEHADAPVMTIHTGAEFQRMLRPFAQMRMVAERFPVATRLHHGWKARLFDGLFVTTFNRLPRRLTRPTGWHLIAIATKQPAEALGGHEAGPVPAI